MRFLAWPVCASVAVAGVLTSPPAHPDATLVITGDIGGYLSPCGCTKPQVGGIRRMAGVVRALLRQPNTTYVDGGNWTKGPGRQEELKAEAVAMVMAGLKPAYINVGESEATMGPAHLRSLNEIAGGMFGSANLRSDGLSGQPQRREGLLWIQGVVGATARTAVGQMKPEDALQGRPRGLSYEVALVSAPRAEAERIAALVGRPMLYVYSLHGDPPKQPKRIGDATFLTVGDRCRYVGVIDLVEGAWTNFRLIELGPEHRDDMDASQAYKIYQQRVAAENLIAGLPRLPGKSDFVGTAKCGSCHARELKIWKGTAHSHALPTLEKVGNDRDPECVGCHVVGLRERSGFKDAKTTPNLANVGCESCHGPGSRHVSLKEKMGKVGVKSCLGCHDAENSPHFDFKKYWPKIRH
jgi:hypothetical protein